MSEIIIPADRDARGPLLERIGRFLAALGAGKWKVTIEEYHPTRSSQQNAYLWGVCYAEFQKHLPGWEKEDIHEYMLGEWSGWEELDGMGSKRVRPLRRSSRLSTSDFSDFVDFIQRKGAEHGVFIPEPDHGG